MNIALDITIGAIASLIATAIWVTVANCIELHYKEKLKIHLLNINNYINSIENHLIYYRYTELNIVNIGFITEIKDMYKIIHKLNIKQKYKHLLRPIIFISYSMHIYILTYNKGYSDNQEIEIICEK